MSGVLIYSDRNELSLDLAAWAAANPVLGPVTVALLGPGAGERAQRLTQSGAARILVVEDPALDDLADDLVAAALAQLAATATASSVLIGATRRGRSLGPRLAQKLDAVCFADAVGLEVVEGRLVVSRFALGGNTITRLESRAASQVISVMPGSVERAGEHPEIAAIEPVEVSLAPGRTRVLERNAKPKAAVDIGESERLVCVGRGLSAREGLAQIEELAGLLDAEVACTRPLSSEYAWLPEERMIGISGERCSPKLMLSLGVSGQVQHTVGIMGSRTIVAVNNDAKAPIFRLADYGIVGDLEALVPALIAALKQRAG